MSNSWRFPLICAVASRLQCCRFFIAAPLLFFAQLFLVIDCGRANEQSPIDPAAKIVVQSSQDTMRCSRELEMNLISKLTVPLQDKTFKIFNDAMLTHITFSSTGRDVAAYTHYGSEVGIWNSADGKLIHRFAHSDPLASNISISFALSDTILISSGPSEFQNTHYMTVEKLTERTTDEQESSTVRSVQLPNSVHNYAYSEVLKQLVAVTSVSAGASLDVYQLNATHGLELIKTLPLERGFGSALAFTANGDWLAVGSYQGDVIIYDSKAWKKFLIISAFPGSNSASHEVPNAVASLSFNSDGSRLAVGAGGVQLIRHRPPNLPFGIRDPNLALEPFVSSELRSPIRIFQLPSFRFLEDVPNARQPITAMYWVGSGALLFLDGNGTLDYFGCVASLEPATSQLTGNGIVSFAVSSDASMVAISGKSGTSVFKLKLSK